MSKISREEFENENVGTEDCENSPTKKLRTAEPEDVHPLQNLAVTQPQAPEKKLQLKVGSAIEQGRRLTMEDELIVLQDKSYFGIFDGHGGATCAVRCKQYLHEWVFAENFHPQTYETYFHNVFQQMDAQLATDPEVGISGTTAAIVHVCWESEHGTKEPEWVLYSANVGDTEVVLGVTDPDDRLTRFKVVTQKHHPYVPHEYDRITGLPGGSVDNGRVCGALAVSRALGDFGFKKNKAGEDYVSAVPHVSRIVLSERYRFMIIASDGVS